MQILSLLPAEALSRLACVNQALYCFANHEDLWRALTLEANSSHDLPFFDLKAATLVAMYLAVMLALW